MNSYLMEFVHEWQSLGYLTASIDSVVSKEAGISRAYLFKGLRMELVYEDGEGGGAKSFDRLLENVEKSLDVKADNGLPFAEVRLNSVVSGDTVWVESFSQDGRLIRLDSLVQLGDTVLNPKALAAHLRLKNGDIYNESKLKTLDSRLKRLPFVSVERSTQMIFAQDKYRVLVGIGKKKANSANGIIGFLPDENGKVRTTGEVDLLLHNSFKSADKISLNWRSLQDRSQSLVFKFSYPYLFNSSLGVKLGLDQFRQDSTFNQITLESGLSLLLDNGDILVVDVIQKEFNNLLSLVDPVMGSDSRSVLYGAEYNRNTLNDPFNPYKGLELVTKISYGSKAISSIKDEKAVSQDFGTWEVAADVKKFMPLGRRSTLFVRLHAFHQESEIILFKELQRIGGLATLRGFDELSIRASTFGVISGEYRFLTDEKAFISAFVDAAYHRSNTEELKEEDTPYGFGLGTAFDTGSGVFTLNYALGSRFSQAPSFKTAKIHFGFIALF